MSVDWQAAGAAVHAVSLRSARWLKHAARQVKVAAGSWHKCHRPFGERIDRLYAGTFAKRSLRLRLSLFFALFLVVAWSCATLIAWREARKHIDLFFDTEQMLFARTLATVDFAGQAERQPQRAVVPPGTPKARRGRFDEDAVRYAVFTRDGGIVMSDGEDGEQFIFEPQKRGFIDGPIVGEDDPWRIVWLDSLDGRHVIAVGQEMEFREDMALKILSKQILPWLVLMPVLLLGLVILLGRELAPLRTMAKQLQKRPPGDPSSLDTRTVPAEALPMAEALNTFIARINALLDRERAFVSDAAHELRTPLAGLRVQAQVATQDDIPARIRREALGHIQEGADRCARLLEQLLVLSRLEAMDDMPPVGDAKSGLTATRVEWLPLLENVLGQFGARAEAKGLRVNCEVIAPDSAVHGSFDLLNLLLGNLLSNAVNYALPGGTIRIRLASRSLLVENVCPRLSPEHAGRVGERFFRPPGQTAPGSGLGLSIVRRIAKLGKLEFAVTVVDDTENAVASVFSACLMW